MTGHYPALITASQIYHHFHGQTVLDNIDFYIKAGEYVSLIGLNGAGKSTLLRILLRLTKPISGDIVHARGLNIGYVPQRWHADPFIPMRVIDFLALNQASANRDQLEQSLNQWHLSDYRHQEISRLSGGQWQRLLLARALLNQPNLLVLDEPTQGLDLPAQHAFYQQLNQLHAQGMTILMVSHDLAHAMSYSQRIVALADAHICCQGKPHEVLAMPQYQHRFVCAHSAQCQHLEHHHA
jgi:zinc transport system ATP-binding protein